VSADDVLRLGNYCIAFYGTNVSVFGVKFGHSPQRAGSLFCYRQKESPRMSISERSDALAKALSCLRVLWRTTEQRLRPQLDLCVVAPFRYSSLQYGIALSHRHSGTCAIRVRARGRAL